MAPSSAPTSLGLRPRTRKQVRLAVVGGGAKAAAIAAKADVLREQGIADIQVTIFESKRIGAYWDGKHGYTDGAQRLCTPAERDVGYPYGSMFGNEVDRSLFARFSWPTYLVSSKQEFGPWVDGGRQPPRHTDFADYLRWVVSEAKPATETCEVAGLASFRKQWLVQRRSGNGRLVSAGGELFDGVVISGPGPARKLPCKGSHDRVFTGSDFWHRLSEVRKLVRTVNDWHPIVIIGAGGTAAATLAWLIANGCRDKPMMIVASQASLYTRVDSVFENRLFTDERAWNELSAANRESFFNRLNRGVVWSTVMNQVSTASRLEMFNGRAVEAFTKEDRELKVTVQRWDGSRIDLPAAFVVDASGFDTWWFLSMIGELSAAGQTDERYRKRLERSTEDDLAFVRRAWGLPRLHVPMLSSKAGPGFATLMVLGAMSDRILGAYMR